MLYFYMWVCYTLFVATSRPAWEGGVYAMEEMVLSFLLSVLAGVIANYISKWFDKRDDGNEPRH